MFTHLAGEVEATWRAACDTARDLGCELLLIGILPTLEAQDLGVHNMSPLNRYRALNEQVLHAREGHPLRLDIAGRESLQGEHGSVMLESATTSFQIHMQVPAAHAHHYYNAAIAASAAVVGAGANSPYLFGHDLWDETRIPLFEQAVEVGGYAEAAHGPMRRVSFGSGYAQASILECFEENLRHFPVLLPMRFEPRSGTLDHLRLHNGTIWRWNRPLLGFDAQGRPHLRIEHRVLPGGPTLVDAMANAAFFYGLAAWLARERAPQGRLPPFSRAKDGFYRAARLGLKATVPWEDEIRVPLRSLILEELLARSADGLALLEVAPQEAARWLGILRERVDCGQTGSLWQRRWVEAHGRDPVRLTRAYLERQREGAPVHTWTL